jgi:hypothetical protein
MSIEVLLILVAVAYGLVNALLETTGKRADGASERREAAGPAQPQAGRGPQPASEPRAAPAQNRPPAPIVRRVGPRSFPRPGGTGKGGRFARSASSVRGMRQRSGEF